MIYHVDQHALREGDGSKARPFRYISDAAKIAQPGDEVLVYPGVYREQVSPANGGTEEQRIVYRSVEPLGAVITGAEVQVFRTAHAKVPRQEDMALPRREQKSVL